MTESNFLNVNLPDRRPAMRTWTDALESRAYHPADFVAIGDSITEGAGATARSARWLDRVAARLREFFPCAARGGEYTPAMFIQNSFVHGWTYGGNIAGDGTFGLAHRGAVLKNPDGFASRQVNGSSIRIHFTTAASLGAFSVWVDGKREAVLNTQSSTSTAHDNGRYWLAFRSPGLHSVEFRWESGGDVYLNGLYTFAGDETFGIRVYDCAQFGSATHNWSRLTNPNAYVTQDDLSLLNPALVLIALGENDRIQGIDPELTRARLTDIVAMVRQSAPRASIVLVSMYAIGRENSYAYPWARYVSVIHDVALSAGAHYVDLSGLDTSGAFLSADGIHPSDTGFAAIAEGILAELVPAYDRRPARIVEPDLHKVPAATRERGYRFLSVDAKTRKITNEFKFKNVGFSLERNAPGEFSGSISLYDKGTVHLVPQNTFLVVERAAQPFWAGFMWQPSRSDKMLNVGAQGFLSVFGHRYVRVSKDWDAVDRGQIVRELIAYGQEGAGGDLGIRVGTETVGGEPMVLSVNWWDKKTVGQAIEEVFKIFPQFTVRVEPSWLPNNVLGLQLVIDPVFPRETPHRLTYNVNVTNYEWAPLSPSPNLIDAFGGFDNEAMLRKTVARTDILDGGAVRIEGTVENRDMLEEGPVEKLGLSALSARSGSPPQPKVDMLGSDDPRLGELLPGMSAQVVIDDGPYVQVNGKFVVKKLDVTIPDGGADYIGAENVSYEFESTTDDAALGVMS